MHRRQKITSSPKGKLTNFMSGERQDEMGDMSDSILKQARKSGQLNLSNRNLTTIPDKVWRINIDVPEEGKSTSLAAADDRWWEQIDLNKLILASNKLTELSAEIQQLQALVVLDIHDNEITNLPEAIGELANLKRLNLSYNKLTSLPPQIGNLTCLVSLLLQHNQLKCLVENIGQLKALEELDISNNVLDDLSSSIGALSNLRKLNLSHNYLTNCPTQFGRMTVLSDLNLSNNKLRELPEGVGNLEKLERLDCRYNQLTSVPTLKSCKLLKELYLGYGQINSIDAHQILCLSSVVVLDIRDNKISHLPVEIATMENLERLDLSNNDLCGLPYQMGNMTNLKSVILDGNPLKSIRRDILLKGTVALLKHLKNKIPESEEKNEKTSNQESSYGVSTHLLSVNKELNYSQQKATTIPDEIWAASADSKVTSVDFSKNLLEQVPLRLCNFEQTLNSVNLGLNRISIIPPEFSLLSQLTHLDVRSNHLSSIPDEFKLLVELREVIISNNRFSNVPEVLYSLSKLEVILASDNQISVINVEGILKLTRLSSLDLSNNSISVVPPELGKARSLRSLQLEGNLFRNPRLAILNKGTAALLDYLKDRIPT